MSSTYDKTFLHFQQTCADSVYTVFSEFHHSHIKPPQDVSKSFSFHLSEECFLIGYGICDGHGIRGEHIAAFAIERILAHFRAKTITYTRLTQAEVNDDITMLFETIQEEIETARMTGGSTCSVVWSVIWADGRATVVNVANVGDSPVFAITSTGVVTRLTVDHSPTNKDEVERLMKNPGSLLSVYTGKYSTNHRSPPVFRQVERDGVIHLELDTETPVALGLKKSTRSGEYGTYFVNPQNVYIPTCIAMGRSLGNNNLRCMGMISTPDLRSFPVASDAQMCIFGCSDGWMDANDEKDIGDIVRGIMSSSTTTEEATTALVAQGFQAAIAWQKELTRGIVHDGHLYQDGFEYTLEQVHCGWDDITCACMNFGMLSAPREASVEVSLVVTDGEVVVSLAALP